MAHIEKRGGKWRARYRQPDGKERSQTFARKVDAEKFVALTEAAKIKGDWINPDLGNITVRQWSREWKKTLGGLRKSTYERDMSYLRTHILPPFGSRRLASIDRFEIERWVAELNTRRKPATVRLAHGVFMRMMELAYRRGLIRMNPCSGISLFPVVNKEKKFLLPEQVALLAGTIHPRYRAYVLVMAYGGLRPGEMAALKPSRVDLDERHIRVVTNVSEVRGHVVWGPPKTWRGNRTVTLPDEVVSELADHMEAYPGNETVFAAPNGGVLRATAWRRRFWHPAVEEAGLAPLIPYALRDTAIAFWIRAGGIPLEVSRRAGHSSVGFTLDKYGHLFPEADAELSGRLSGLYMVPKKADKDDSDEETQSPAASPRPDEVDEVAARRAKESLTRDADGGASKNRTYDLSIISAAL